MFTQEEIIVGVLALFKCLRCLLVMVPPRVICYVQDLESDVKFWKADREKRSQFFTRDGALCLSLFASRSR